MESGFEVLSPGGSLRPRINQGRDPNPPLDQGREPNPPLGAASPKIDQGRDPNWIRARGFEPRRLRIGLGFEVLSPGGSELD